MIQSMTGYGKAEVNLKINKIIIEIRSLNAKNLDINVKLPYIYKEKEMIIRKLLSKRLERGKIDFFISESDKGNNLSYRLNTTLIKKYFQEIRKLSNELNFPNIDIMPAILKMPNTLIKKQETTNKNDWKLIKQGVMIAIDNLLDFRNTEGALLKKDIEKRIKNIMKLSKKILPLEKRRVKKIETNLMVKIKTLQNKKIDKSRLEQELLYYVEKQDITEEIIRLDSHLKYFTKTIQKQISNGKTLAFISQEIGREINTIGAKSCDAAMQKNVIKMKEELEKVKEQLLNIV